MVTSSDGYCTIIEFNPSELTEPLEQEAIDEHTKNVCSRTTTPRPANTPNPQPEPSTRSPQTKPLHPQLAVDPKPSTRTLNPPLTQSPQPEALKPSPRTINPNPQSALDPNPQLALNPKP